MNATDDYVRQLVAEGWVEGHAGRGLLLREPDRLLTWRDLSHTAGPHHADVHRACEVSPDVVVAALSLRADGSFVIYGPKQGDAEVAARIRKLDPRLRLSTTGWPDMFADDDWEDTSDS